MKSGFATNRNAYNYLLSEYHGASAAGDNQLALDIYDAILIMRRAMDKFSMYE